MVQHGAISTGAVRRWLTAYTRYLTFVEGTGSLPTETPSTADPDQVRLANWGRYQRKRLLRGTLLPWQRALLEEIPGFTWDDRWTIQLHGLAAFLANKQRMPRYRSADLVEHQLAAWVHKQRHLYRAGHLSYDRVATLRRLPFKIL